jgi:IQ calmodulin-binding motif
MSEMHEILRDIVSKHQDEFLPYIVHIQAYIRGFLARKRLSQTDPAYKPWHNRLLVHRLRIFTYDHLLRDCSLIGSVIPASYVGFHL